MRNKKGVLLEYGIYLFLLVFALRIAPAYLLEKIAVEGTSMENTLFNDEHLLIEKVSRYLDGPDRFDIIVFTKNHGTYNKTYIKRVIGLPGETVQIIGSTIYINGEPLTESYGKDPISFSGTASELLQLGEGEYFVLGDNRKVSVDSRDAKVGLVKKEELDGVVILRISPWASFGTVQ